MPALNHFHALLAKIGALKLKPALIADPIQSPDKVFLIGFDLVGYPFALNR
jgi:hypothetical protein